MGKSNLPWVGRAGIIMATALVVLILSTCATNGPGKKKAQALPAPVGEWLMNGGLSDSSGNGNDGTSLGGTSFAPDRHGIPHAALSVSAINGPDNNAKVSSLASHWWSGWRTSKTKGWPLHFVHPLLSGLCPPHSPYRATR